MDKLAPMDTIDSIFCPWLSCQGICWLNSHQTGDTDSVQPVILLPVQRDRQETFIPCEARTLWYSAERTSSQQLRDTTKTSGYSPFCETSAGSPFASLVHREKNTRRDVDCTSRQAYNIGIIMAPCEGGQYAGGTTARQPRQYGLIRAT